MAFGNFNKPPRTVANSNSEVDANDVSEVIPTKPKERWRANSDGTFVRLDTSEEQTPKEFANIHEFTIDMKQHDEVTEPSESNVLESTEKLEEKFPKDSTPESRKDFRQVLTAMVNDFPNESNVKPVVRKDVFNPKKYISGLHLMGDEPDLTASKQAPRGPVLDSIGDFSHRNKKETLSKVEDVIKGDSRALKNAVELSKKSEVENERNKMQEKEAIYLAAYKEYYSKTNAAQRLHHKVGNFDELNKLNVLKATYDNSRLDYAKKLQHSVHDRLQEKLENGRGTKGNRTPEEVQKILERYNGSIRLREIVKPGLEKKHLAKMEALEPKEKGILNTFAKGVAWGDKQVKEFNKSIEGSIEKYANEHTFFGKKLSETAVKHFAKNGARAAKLLITTSAFTGAGLATGGMGYAAAGLYAGQKVVRGLISIGLGGTVGALAGKGYELTGGKKAAKKLQVARGSDIRSIADLESHAQAEKHGSKESIAAKRAIVENAAAGLMSFGFSFEQAHELATHHSVQMAAGKLDHVKTEMHAGLAHSESHPANSTPIHEHSPQHKPVHSSHHYHAHHPHAAAGQEEHVVAAPAPAEEAPTPDNHTELSSEEQIQKNYVYENTHHGFAPNSDITADANTPETPTVSPDATSVQTHDVHDLVPAHETPSASVPAEHTPVAAEIPSHSPEVFTNAHGVEVDAKAPHLYEMVDSDTHEKTLAFYGDPSSNTFIEDLEKFGRENPGKKIFFDSPVPLPMGDGTTQPWINMVTFDPKAGFTIPVLPPDQNFIGWKIDPQNFIRELQ